MGKASKSGRRRRTARTSQHRDAAVYASEVPCFHPLPAQRSGSGEVVLWKEIPDGLPLRLPCGGCIGCRTAQAKAWALRCQLELEQHDRAAWVNPTYDQEKLPVTLSKRHLQLYLKKIRKHAKNLGAGGPIRFFASGEYGEANHRPHYHIILYGVDPSKRDLLASLWGAGRTMTYPVTPANIAYTAGYTAKKVGWPQLAAEERIDYETGELYQWQPPFIQMSRRPGIGAAAKQFVNSWRLYAVANGYRMPVPRFLHEAWKAQATPQDLEDLVYEKSKLAAHRDTSVNRLEAAEKIASAKQSLHGQKRKL